MYATEPPSTRAKTELTRMGSRPAGQALQMISSGWVG
jgi:hypothetical protein